MLIGDFFDHFTYSLFSLDTFESKQCKVKIFASYISVKPRIFFKDLLVHTMQIILLFKLIFEFFQIRDDAAS